jgi:peptide/nickel transport system ATP-binding protein
MTAALRVSDLSKSFPVGKPLFGAAKAHVHAVRSITLDLLQGETLGIVGESGCGKSTLARMLVGLIRPSAGQIEIEGADLNAANPAEFGRRIQYVFQDPISSLNPRKTIRQIMEAPLRHLHGLDGAQREQRILEIFDAVNLRAEFLDRYPHEFSGGQAQRIGIARALAAQARILILDEPVSALDVSVQAQVLNLLGRLKRELSLTYLFISHNLSVVEAMSDRVAVLYFGRVVELGPSEAIFRAPRHPYTKLLANSAPTVGRSVAPTAMSGELPNPLDPPKGCAFRSRCPRAVERCALEDPPLFPMGADLGAACFNPVPAD